MKHILIADAALSLAGCANEPMGEMTCGDPECRTIVSATDNGSWDRAGEVAAALLAVMSAGAMGYAAATPVYQPPVTFAPFSCHRMGNFMQCY